MTLWESLLVLQARWEERIKDNRILPRSEGEFWEEAHKELSEIIKRYTREKPGFKSIG